MKKITAVLAALMLICTLFPATFAEEAIRGYVKGSGYVYVLLGTYPTTKDGGREPVLWRVLYLEDETNEALLLTERIIDVQQVIFCDNKKDSDARRFRKINDYGESDMNVWMNETMFPDIMGDDPIIGAVVDKQYGKLYPLTDDQHLNSDYGFDESRWFDHKCRMCEATDYARNHKLYEKFGENAKLNLYVENGYATYWSATIKNPDDYYMSIVGVNGHLSYGAYTRINIGLRPALVLDMDMCGIVSGAGTMDDPFVLEYLPGN